MLARRIQGRTLAEIAREFNTTINQVQKVLAPEARTKFLDAAKDALMGLVPKSIKVYDAALERSLADFAAGDIGSTDIATKVLKEAVPLLNADQPTFDAGGHSDADIEYEVWRARISQRRTNQLPAINATPQPSSHPLRLATGGDEPPPPNGALLASLDAAPRGSSHGEGGPADGDLRDSCGDPFITRCPICGTELLEGQPCPTC